MSQPADPSLAESLSSTGVAPAASAAPFDPSEAVQSAGILIVDEDESFRLGLETFLREYVGFEEIYTASNGLEALEELREHPSIEMITADYQMPEMDGITFLERVNEGDFPPLAVVMITGFPSDDLAMRFRGLDSEKLLTEHFLEKPVDFNDLESVILRSYEALKRRQRDGVVAAEGDEAGAPSEKEKREEAARNIERMFAGSLREEGEDEHHLQGLEQGDAGGFQLGVPPDAASEAGGVSEVRARIDWMGDTFNGRFDQLEAQVDNISSRMPSMAERFWLGLLKWTALGLLAWGFVRFDFGDRLIGWYEIGKAKLIELSAGPAAGADEAAATADEASDSSDSSDGGDDAAPAAPIPPDADPSASPPAADPEPDPKDADANADAGR